MQISFDGYTVSRNSNGKSYTQIRDAVSPSLRYQAQQVTTWMANSLLVMSMPVAKDTSLSDIVALNTSQLEKKLLNYKSIDQTRQDVSCQDLRLPGYVTTFSYDIDANQKLYSYQYYILQADTLYLISFQSDDKKDIKATAKSIKRLHCQ